MLNNLVLSAVLSSLKDTNQTFCAGEVIIESINLETRDVVVKSVTPKLRKPVKIVLHMFKNETHGDNPAWAGRIKWNEDPKFTVGAKILYVGHQGNIKDDKYGRVICTGYGYPEDLASPVSDAPAEDTDDDYDA